MSNENYIGMVNEHCQRSNIKPPQYIIESKFNDETNTICFKAKCRFLNKNYKSHLLFSTKREAKKDVARLVWLFITTDKLKSPPGSILTTENKVYLNLNKSISINRSTPKVLEENERGFTIYLIDWQYKHPTVRGDINIYFNCPANEINKGVEFDDFYITNSIIEHELIFGLIVIIMTKKTGFRLNNIQCYPASIRKNAEVCAKLNELTKKISNLFAIKQ